MQPPGVWVLGENKGAEPLRASISVGEALLIAADAPACLFGLHLFNGRLGDTDDRAAEHSQDERRIGIAHAAAVLIQGDLQGMVQTAFKDSIATFEFDSAQGVESFEGQAADQIGTLTAR